MKGVVSRCQLAPRNSLCMRTQPLSLLKMVAFCKSDNRSTHGVNSTVLDLYSYLAAVACCIWRSLSVLWAEIRWTFPLFQPHSLPPQMRAITWLLFRTHRWPKLPSGAFGIQQLLCSGPQARASALSRGSRVVQLCVTATLRKQALVSGVQDFSQRDFRKI